MGKKQKKTWKATAALLFLDYLEGKKKKNYRSSESVALTDKAHIFVSLYSLDVS